MSEDYQEFMIYELTDEGERIKLQGATAEAIGSLLNPEQVLVIVHEQIRKIFIWKGAKSSVRKRFISSRIAGQLQEELVKIAAFHRCKIISIDQGDELSEFLDAFNLESMEVTETLEDLRYVRNIEKQGGFGGKVLEDKKVTPTAPEPSTADMPPDAEEIKAKPHLTEDPKSTSKPAHAPTQTIKRVVETSPLDPEPAVSVPTPAKVSSPQRNVVPLNVNIISEDLQKAIKDKILKTELPENHKRVNLVIGHTLYGAVAKKVKVFGKEIEETDWEEITSLPKGMIEIDAPKIRAYFDDKGKILEAIEILEKATDENKKAEKAQPRTPDKQKKEPEPSEKDKTETDAPKKSATAAKKAPKSSSGRRPLPKVPSDK